MQKQYPAVTIKNMYCYVSNTVQWHGTCVIFPSVKYKYTEMNTICKFLYFIILMCIILAGDGRITSIINLGDIMKILVIFTGGTIGSTENGSYVSPDKEKPYKLINMYKESATKHKGSSNIIFDILTPYQALSENISCNNFRILSECLEKVDKNAYDGIIITHGTDTLQYTAAFTGYIMAGAQIPIVIVSANYVLEDARSNGVDNFYYAVEFICQKKGKGVFVSYHNTGDYPKIHRATRLVMHQAYSDSIYSICDSYYGYFDKEKFVYNNKYYINSNVECKKEDIFNVPSGSWYSGIMEIHPYPGMEYTLPGDSIKAVLHYTYHSGTICSTTPGLRQFAEYTKTKGIPVFITGAGLGADYESMGCYNEFGFYVLPAASPEAMYIKLWLCIINNKNPDVIAETMQVPVADDIYG